MSSDGGDKAIGYGEDEPGIARRAPDPTIATYVYRSEDACNYVNHILRIKYGRETYSPRYRLQAFDSGAERAGTVARLPPKFMERGSSSALDREHPVHVICAEGPHTGTIGRLAVFLGSGAVE